MPPHPPRTSLAAGTVQVARESLRYLKIEPVSQATDAAALDVPARVIFRDAAVSRVGTPVTGRVIKVHVDVGAAVKEGDALVTLRSPDAAGARTQLRSTDEALRVARLQADRVRAMFDQGVATERERIDAELAVARLEAEAARARVTAQFVGAGSAGDVVVRAPIAGNVLSRNATVGAEVTPDSGTLVEIGDANAVLVQADVFERDLALVKAGAPVKVALASQASPVDGRVISVGASLDPVLRTAPVRISISGDPSHVRPGMFGRATILAGEPTITVPSSAVLIRNGVDTVLYVDAGDATFRRRPVRVGHSIKGRVQVLSGLSAGERVVTEGGLLLDAAADQLI